MTHNYNLSIDVDVQLYFIISLSRPNRCRLRKRHQWLLHRQEWHISACPVTSQ